MTRQSFTPSVPPFIPPSLQQVINDLQEIHKKRGDVPVKFCPTSNHSLTEGGIPFMDAPDHIIVFVAAVDENDLEPGLEPPLVPIEHLNNFFLESGSHVLGQAIERRNKNHQAISTLLKAFLWAVQTAQEAERYDGLVLHETNETGRELYYQGLQAIYTLSHPTPSKDN